MVVGAAAASERHYVMLNKPIPTRPIDAYKRIIDDLVDRTPGISSRLVREEGIFTKSLSPAVEDMNGFVRSLTPEQREILARMLVDERAAGIGEVLSALSWWFTCQGLAFVYRGEPMPVELSGMGLHGDYVGRLEGWQWPLETPPKA